MIIHELKLEQPFFDDVFYGRKEFEVRKNDRNFQIGDRLKLIEFPFTGKQKYVLKDIKYILEGNQFGIEKGYVVLGLKETPHENHLDKIIGEGNSLTYVKAGRI